MALMQPGKYNLPDQRCWDRVFNAMSDPEGIVYKHIIPCNVRSVLDEAMSNSQIDIMRAWWKFNNHTHFFKHPTTARLVRVLMKKLHLVCADDGSIGVDNHMFMHMFDDVHDDSSEHASSPHMSPESSPLVLSPSQGA